MHWAVTSRSAEHTRRLGVRLGKLLQGGEIVGLIGELGTGKTCFVRGLTEGLGVSRETWIRTPSFRWLGDASRLCRAVRGRAFGAMAGHAGAMA